MSKALILMYHNIDEPPKEEKIPDLYVTPKMFEFQMWYVKSAGLNVVSLKDLIASVGENRKTTKKVALTFDDGYMDFYENAYPILRRYGYPSTVFITSDYVGKTNTWDLATDSLEKPLMDWKTIIEISKHGVNIGSHTKTHPYLDSLSMTDLIGEISDSKKEIEQQLNQPVNYFCYPYGLYNAKVREAVIKANYAGAVSITKGLVKAPFDRFGLNRITVKLTTGPLSFVYKIHRKYLYERNE